MAKTAPMNETIYEPLLDTESSMMVFLGEPSVTTISLFKDVDHANSVTYLKQRLTLICQANPWIAGRLIKDKTKHKDNVILAMPSSIHEHDVDTIFSTEEDSILTPLNTTTPFSHLCTTIDKSSAMVPIGYRLIGRDQRVTKFTFIQNKDKNECFLIVSMTHAVVDGHTYYKIMSMLTEQQDITSLSFRRKHEFVPQMKEATGIQEYKMLTSPGMLMSMIPAMICGTPALCHARFVDVAEVERIKTEASARTSSSSASFACSTNDILTSTFAQAIPADLIFMATNFRERVPLVTDMDAGNYESVIVYDQASTTTPEAIRASLRAGIPFQRVGGNPLPGFWKLLRTRYGMITNWAFSEFRADLKLRTESNEEAPMALHLPIMSPSFVIFPIAVIFRPCEGKLAVLYMGSARDLQMKRLEASGAPLGPSLNEVMFAEA